MGVKFEDRYDSLIIFWANRYGRDPKQVKRQIRIESGFDSMAVSPEGAQGLMQFMVDTWNDQTSPGASPFNPEANIMVGCKYMRWLEESLGSLRLALAAYNWGIGHVRTVREQILGPGQEDKILEHAPMETRAYVLKCMEYKS